VRINLREEVLAEFDVKDAGGSEKQSNLLLQVVGEFDLCDLPSSRSSRRSG
jgi:hypothetical protein